MCFHRENRSQVGGRLRAGSVGADRIGERLESVPRATLFLMAQVTLESGRTPLSRARSQASRSLTEVLS
jgi:hypothetical protein